MDVGTEGSVRGEIERECETIRIDAVQACAGEGSNWLVHWVNEYSGTSTNEHYCEAGVVAGESELTICDGSGSCAAGQATTVLQGSASRACQGYGGQALELACDVFCTRCQNM